MVRAPFFDMNGLRRGAWSREEDDRLRAYVQRYGHWNWRQLPKFAGLSRCGKSCRLRWMNYLRPGVRHGNYSKQEHDLIIKLHEQLGNKWSVIASKLPGRTDNEVKNYWHTHLKKRAKHKQTRSGSEDLPAATSSINDQVRQVVEDKNIVDVLPSQLVLESSPLSPESSSSKISLITYDLSTIVTPSYINCAAEDSFTSFESYEISCGDFWTEPFIADNQDAQFMSPHVSVTDDNIDLLYQIMQELRRN